MHIDLNCDMGEGTGNDRGIMPFISSANIACGYHAGDITTMDETIRLCVAHNVAIGAHVSFYDKENFGRSAMELPVEDIYDLVTQQLIIIQEVADSQEQKIKHVKPHGALYNMSAGSKEISMAIAQAIKDFDSNLVLYGLSGSHAITAAESIELVAASEVFADRTYQDDGSLTPRSSPGAMITDVTSSVQQVIQMIKEQTVVSVNNKKINVVADTVCLHGDGANAVAFAESIFHTLKHHTIVIKAL